MSAGTLQRRVSLLELAQANPGDERHTVMRQALRELFATLRQLVPDPVGSLEPVGDMAHRITVGRATAGDRAVMNALPPAALDALGMDAVEFMALLHSVDSAV